MNYTAIISNIYEAFGKGDIPAIMEHISEQADWEYGASDHSIPWLQHGTGHDAVLRFFTALQGLEFHQFHPKMLFANGNIVVALIDLEVTVKTTGKRIVEEDEVHIWHLDETGKVNRFRHRVDTLQHYLATQP